MELNKNKQALRSIKAAIKSIKNGLVCLEKAIIAIDKDSRKPTNTKKGRLKKRIKNAE